MYVKLYLIVSPFFCLILANQYCWCIFTCDIHYPLIYHITSDFFQDPFSERLCVVFICHCSFQKVDHLCSFIVTFSCFGLKKFNCLKKNLCSCSPTICFIDVIFVSLLFFLFLFLTKKEEREER